MNQERLLNVLQAPHVSEKATRYASQYIFKVMKDATKPEIKAAVEEIFKVNVKAVRICNVKSRRTRFGRTMGRQQGWKKAYVTLKEGQEIEITD